MISRRHSTPLSMTSRTFMRRLIRPTTTRTIRSLSFESRMRFPSESSASPSMREDYRQWKAIGKGGTAHSWGGYISSLSAEKTIAFSDTISPQVYRKPEKYATGWFKASASQRAAAQSSFLKDALPERESPRSRTLRYVYPQREKFASDFLDPDIEKAYQAAFSQLGSNNNSITEWKTSCLEKQGTALFLKPSLSLNPIASPSQREICHLHVSDMSGHVTLSFADAEEVISKGWGERHRLSGTDWIHLGYTMLYVPRNVDEIDVFIRILQAGVDFMRA